MHIFVRPGDSVAYYSQLFRIPMQLILDSNDSLTLTAGHAIKIPGFITRTYTIQRNDSLSQIADKLNLHIDALLLMNPTLQKEKLKTGLKIMIPIRVTWRIVQGQQNYDYETLTNDLHKLHTIYPFIRRNSIGHSVLNREIPSLFIGNGPKLLHFNASFHANEWITTPVLMTFLNDYLLAITNNQLLQGMPMLAQYVETTLSIVPMVNPDGVDLVLNGLPPDEVVRDQLLKWNNGSNDFSGWKANINGVDLNDQFPADWELERANNPKSPGPRDYGGEHPLSQPESIAMANLTERMNFARVLALHTQGEVIYWGYQGLEPPQAEDIVNEMAAHSGYEPVNNAGSYAGYKDWFIQNWGRPGFTVELGLGHNPLPISQFDEIYEKSLGIFLAALYCK